MNQSALNLLPCQNTGGPDLERVKGKLGPVVLKWARHRWQVGTHHFYLKDLVTYVWGTYTGRYCSPSSPGRTLQALRLEGWLDYKVLNRSQSFYRLTSIVMFGEERLP